MEKLERNETATRIRMISNGMRKPRIVSILRSLGKKDDRNLLHLLGLVHQRTIFKNLPGKKETSPLQRLNGITLYLAKELHTT